MTGVDKGRKTVTLRGTVDEVAAAFGTQKRRCLSTRPACTTAAGRASDRSGQAGRCDHGCVRDRQTPSGPSAPAPERNPGPAVHADRNRGAYNFELDDLRQRARAWRRRFRIPVRGAADVAALLARSWLARHRALDELGERGLGCRRCLLRQVKQRRPGFERTLPVSARRSHAATLIALGVKRQRSVNRAGSE